ncbi:hypothetical protein D3C87_1657640 [compost metagenome]
MRVVRHDRDLGPGLLRRLEEGDEVARVLGGRGQDAIARLERDRVEGHVPGPGRVLEQGDLVAVRPDESGDVVVDLLNGLVLLARRLVAPDPSLELQVSDRGVQDGLGHQGGPGVVEVDHVFAAGGLGAGAADVDGHGRLSLAKR